MSTSSTSPPQSPPEDPARTAEGRRRPHGDLVAGGIFVALGAAFTLTSLGYGLGTLRTMSTGMFPFIAGVLLVGLGVAIVLTSLRSPEDTPGLSRFPLRGAACVLGALVFFAFVLPVAGLLPATFGAALLSGLAAPDNPLRRVLLTSVGITVAAYLIFVLGLQVRIPVVGS